MDGMVENGMAQAMMKLSYFDPFMLINRSGVGYISSPRG